MTKESHAGAPRGGRGDEVRTGPSSRRTEPKVGEIAFRASNYPSPVCNDFGGLGVRGMRGGGTPNLDLCT